MKTLASITSDHQDPKRIPKTHTPAWPQHAWEGEKPFPTNKNSTDYPMDGKTLYFGSSSLTDLGKTWKKTHRMKGRSFHHPPKGTWIDLRATQILGKEKHEEAAGIACMIEAVKIDRAHKHNIHIYLPCRTHPKVLDSYLSLVLALTLDRRRVTWRSWTLVTCPVPGFWTSGNWPRGICESHEEQQNIMYVMYYTAL